MNTLYALPSLNGKGAYPGWREGCATPFVPIFQSRARFLAAGLNLKKKATGTPISKFLPQRSGDIPRAKMTGQSNCRKCFINFLAIDNQVNKKC